MAFPHPLPNPANPMVRFFFTIFLSMTIVIAVFLLLAAGEELGWRGFMLTRLIEAKISWPLLVSGLIWSLFHVPFIISGQYKPGEGPSIVLAVGVFL